ncbi:MAG: cytidine deaminase [Bacilli bacterium]|nr:cytidine deaminase [Bacilli bacterium]MDD4282608.1 cytidine deaminase [Bacilli bacterium]MDD4718522.1 cytidine deaminase [Bacilli bacterium]
MKQKLQDLLGNAYAPYSNYQVAAIVVTKDNQIFGGVNVENASYGATICAERNAINSAIAAGYKKGDFKELYVMVASTNLAFPCNICRQVIVEFFDMEDVLYLMNDTDTKTYLMKDIIVYPFSVEDLK